MTGLPTECQSTLEALLSEEEIAAETQRHLQECPSCETLAQEMARDQERLRQALASIPVPPVPALSLPDALHSASGHPRRTSLTLMPFFLLLILVLSLGAVALALYALRQADRSNREAQTRSELGDIADSIRDARGRGLEIHPGNWVTQLRISGRLSKLTLRTVDEVAEFVDPFDHAYRLGPIEGVLSVYSVGANGIDEEGGGDDLWEAVGD